MYAFLGGFRYIEKAVSHGSMDDVFEYGIYGTNPSGTPYTNRVSCVVFCFHFSSYGAYQIAIPLDDSHKIMKRVINNYNTSQWTEWTEV